MCYEVSVKLLQLGSACRCCPLLPGFPRALARLVAGGTHLGRGPAPLSSFRVAPPARRPQLSLGESQDTSRRHGAYAQQGVRAAPIAARRLLRFDWQRAGSVLMRRSLWFAARRKGISKSALPYRRTPPSWLKVNPGEVTEHVCKLARKGLTPSQIGVILRDSHGIAQVAHVTGSKILRILKKQGA